MSKSLGELRLILIFSTSGSHSFAMSLEEATITGCNGTTGNEFGNAAGISTDGSSNDTEIAGGESGEFFTGGESEEFFTCDTVKILRAFTDEQYCGLNNKSPGGVVIIEFEAGNGM